MMLYRVSKKLHNSCRTVVKPRKSIWTTQKYDGRSGPRFKKNLKTNHNRISYLLTLSYVYDFS